MAKRAKIVWTICIMFLVSATPLPAAPERDATARTTADLREAFEAEYRLFLAAPLYLPDRSRGYSSSLDYSAEALTFRERMLGMGPAVIPFLMEKLKELNETPRQSARAEFLAYEIRRVARRWFADTEWPGGKIGGTRETDRIDIVLSWWAAGQKGTTERFEDLYSAWKRLKVRQSLLSDHKRQYVDGAKLIIMSRVETTELGRTLEAISGLGLGALPPMMDKLRAGDYDVLPFIAEIRRDEAATLLGIEPATERARRCLEWWDKNKEQWTIPFSDVVQTTPAGAAVPAEPVTAEKATAPAEAPLQPAQPPAPAG